jgi:hypothetical protein
MHQIRIMAMKHLFSITSMASIVLTLALICSTPTDAKKPTAPPGGGGGKDGGSYSARFLDSVPGTAFDIAHHEDYTEVVGRIDPGIARYWLLDADGETVFFADLAGNGSKGARAINRDGVIVGWDIGADGARPVVWQDFVAPPLELPVPDGFTGGASAHDINDNLLVVGYLTPDNGVASVVAWQLDIVNGFLVTRDTIVVATGDELGTVSLNNNGFLAAAVDYHAWRWQVIWNPELGTAGGLEVVSADHLFQGTVTGINEAGTVCGQYTGALEGYVMTLDGDLTLFTLPVNGKENASLVQATAINDAIPIQVAGSGDVWRGNQFTRSPTVIWDLDGDMVTLPLDDSSPLVLNTIYALDDAGWGVGMSHDSTTHLPVIVIPK